MKINCLGDSITEGWSLPSPAEQSFPALLEEKFPEHIFTNYGIAGAMVQPFGYGYSQSLPYKEALQNPADLNLLLLGSNDGYAYSPQFKSYYKELLKTIPDPVILITPPVMGLQGTALPQIRQDILDIGKETGHPVIDLYEASDPSWLGDDQVHPTVQGQKKIAQFLSEKLQPFMS